MSLGAELSQDIESAANATETSAKDTAGLIVAAAAATGFASLLIGLALSFLIGRSIKQPIVNLTRAMSALANGDTKVAIPNATESNEIGEMAKAVLVFQGAAVENARLEREAADHRARADGERARNEQAQRQAIEQERASVAGSIGAALSKLAQQDLTCRLPADIPEAYRKLQADFNAAIGQLEAAMKGVTGSAECDPGEHAGNHDRFRRPGAAHRAAGGEPGGDGGGARRNHHDGEEIRRRREPCP